MQPVRRFDHIEGLHPREPVGAVVTIGVKGPSGAPTKTDRFYFVLPHDEKVGDILRRPLHPAFAAFNADGSEQVEKERAARRVLRGNLVHAHRDDCFRHHLKAQVLPKPWPAHPNKRPACLGDGAFAVRYHGTKPDGSDDFREIGCPNDLCEFRQGDRKPCKPFAQLLFRPRWQDGATLPQPLTKITTGSWHSSSALLGFFDYLEAQAREIGIANPSLYGIPFTLTLARKTNPKRAASFPVIAISPDCDLVAFFVRQREDLGKITAGQPRELPPAKLTDPELQSDEVLAADSELIVPSKPSSISAEVVDVETEPGEPALLSPERVASLRELAASRGLNADEIAADLCGADLDGTPASFDAAIMRALDRSGKRGAK